MRDTAAVYYATQLSRRGLPVAIQYVHALALQALPARQGGAERAYVILLQDRLGRVSTLRSTADAARALWRDEAFGDRRSAIGPPADDTSAEASRPRATGYWLLARRARRMREIDVFLAHPTPERLAGAPDEAGYLLRVGMLFGQGVVTAGEARELLARIGVTGVALLEGVRDDYRCRPPGGGGVQGAGVQASSPDRPDA